jgi:hypothetical protein
MGYVSGSFQKALQVYDLGQVEEVSSGSEQGRMSWVLSRGASVIFKIFASWRCEMEHLFPNGTVREKQEER